MSFKVKLSGGDPRSLGKTDEVVDEVLKQPSKLSELFECLFSTDEIVRMRAGDGLEKICYQKPDWFIPYIQRLLTQVPKINQPSVQWHLAQILSEIQLEESQKHRAVTILKHNLKTFDDWIVANLTLESLAKFARDGSLPRAEFVNILKQHQRSRHKSVVSRSNKLLREFAN